MAHGIRPKYPLTVFYDGSCPVCSREMAGYMKRSSPMRLKFIDISRPDFEPSLYGRTRQEFMAAMHARDAAGKFYVGVDAFRALWLGMPGDFYPMLANLIALPGAYRLARAGYRVFARLRHLLPPV